MKTIKFLQKKLNLIRKEICKLIRIDPNFKNKVMEIITTYLI